MMDKSVGTDNIMDPSGHGAFVEVMFAKSIAEARQCCGILEEQQIPAQLEAGADVQSSGVAVLVPAERFVEASEVLAIRAHDDDISDDDVGSDDMDDTDDDIDDDFDDDDDDDDDDVADDDEDDEEEGGTDEDF